MNRIRVWLKLKLPVGDQWEERLENRDWGRYKSTERVRRHEIMTQNRRTMKWSSLNSHFTVA